MIIEDNLKLARLIGKAEDGSSVVSLEGSEEALAIANAVRKDVEQERREKNIVPQMHWDFYHAFQEKYFVQRRYEDNAQFQERKNKGRVVNYVRFIVDLDTRFLYGRPNKIGRRYGGNDKTEKRFETINKYISIDNLQMEAKRKASLFGEQGFRLIPVDKTTGSQVDITTTMNENVYPHPVPLDARTTFFLLNPYGKTIAVTIVTEVKDYVDQERTVKITELITDDSRWVWHDDALQEAALNIYSIREEFILEKNNPERIDNVQDMLPLQTSLNECLTDNVYFFARHGRPQLVSSVDLKNVIGKDNMVWEIRVEEEENRKVLDKLGFLVWDGKMEAAAEHVKELEAKIFKVSSTAAISTGDLKGIGNLRSGAALITAHSPSIQKSQEQQIIWIENEEKFSHAIAEFDSKIHSTTVEARFPELQFELNFPKESGVPGEEIMNAEVRQIEINSHLATIEDLIRQQHPDFTDEEIAAYRAQLIKDSEDIIDSKRAFLTETKESNSNSSGTTKSTEQRKPTE